MPEERKFLGGKESLKRFNLAEIFRSSPLPGDEGFLVRALTHPSAQTRAPDFYPFLGFLLSSV